MSFESKAIYLEQCISGSIFSKTSWNTSLFTFDGTSLLLLHIDQVIVHLNFGLL